jgi:hypothetical protein
MRFLIAVLLLSATTLVAQESMNDDSTLKLVKSGNGEDLIVSMVKSQPAQNHFEPSQSARAQSSISKARCGCHQRCTSPHPPRSAEIQPLSARGVLRIV